MDKAHTSQEKSSKRSAEDWLQVAKDFGAKCLKVQQDATLDIDQIFNKLQTLSNDMIKEIKEDKYLEKRDKDQMISSIHTYMEERKEMHDVIKNSNKKGKAVKS